MFPIQRIFKSFIQDFNHPIILQLVSCSYTNQVLLERMGESCNLVPLSEVTVQIEFFHGSLVNHLALCFRTVTKKQNTQYCEKMEYSHNWYRFRLIKTS